MNFIPIQHSPNLVICKLVIIYVINCTCAVIKTFSRGHGNAVLGSYARAHSPFPENITLRLLWQSISNISILIAW